VGWRSKREVAVVYKSLQKHGFSVGALHGDMDQSARTAALDQFRKGEIPLLVASDVAARGLDIPAVTHVFNFDVPHHADDYVHRIGRTGRAGRAGTAISIVTPLDNKSIAAIERLIGQTIPAAEGDYTVHSDSSEASDQPREHRSREGSREGSRGGRKPRREREPRGEREPRQARGTDKRSDKSSDREPRHAKGAGRSAAPQPAADFAPPAPAQPSRVPSIGRPEPRRAHREVESEPADHSHLPAFLLRPVRARV
jgi:superfamily II DNA/RNA helicase